MRAKRRAHPFTLALGKIALAAAILCRTDVPLSDLKEGVVNRWFSCKQGKRRAHRRAPLRPSPTLWEQGAPPCAPTPLSHALGEGLGVRA